MTESGKQKIKEKFLGKPRPAVKRWKNAQTKDIAKFAVCDSPEVAA